MNTKIKIYIVNQIWRLDIPKIPLIVILFILTEESPILYYYGLEIPMTNLCLWIWLMNPSYSDDEEWVIKSVSKISQSEKDTLVDCSSNVILQFILWF